jgi:hypothetical protein
LDLYAPMHRNQSIAISCPWMSCSTKAVIMRRISFCRLVQLPPSAQRPKWRGGGRCGAPSWLSVGCLRMGGRLGGVHAGRAKSHPHHTPHWQCVFPATLLLCRWPSGCNHTRLSLVHVADRRASSIFSVLGALHAVLVSLSQVQQQKQ